MIEKLVAEATECDFNRSFDAIITDARKEDYSFTLLEATYLEKTGNHFASSDYISFGLADKDGFLTNAGKLMADQYIVRNSRVSCTRWSMKATWSVCYATAVNSCATTPRCAS